MINESGSLSFLEWLDDPETHELSLKKDRFACKDQGEKVYNLMKITTIIMKKQVF